MFKLIPRPSFGQIHDTGDRSSGPGNFGDASFPAFAREILDVLHPSESQLDRETAEALRRVSNIPTDAATAELLRQLRRDVSEDPRTLMPHFAPERIEARAQALELLSSLLTPGSANKRELHHICVQELVSGSNGPNWFSHNREAAARILNEEAAKGWFAPSPDEFDPLLYKVQSNALPASAIDSVLKKVPPETELFILRNAVEYCSWHNVSRERLRAARLLGTPLAREVLEAVGEKQRVSPELQKRLGIWTFPKLCSSIGGFTISALGLILAYPGSPEEIVGGGCFVAIGLLLASYGGFFKPWRAIRPLPDAVETARNALAELRASTEPSPAVK